MPHIAVEQPDMDANSTLESLLIATQIVLFVWKSVASFQSTSVEPSKFDLFESDGRECAGGGSSAEGGHQQNTTQPHGLSTSSPVSACSHNDRTTKGGNYQSRGRGSDDEDNDPHRPRQDPPSPHNDSKQAKQQVCCPLYLVDRLKYHECGSLDMKDWKALREHIIDRKHAMGDQCPVCGQIFYGADFEKDWEAHTRLQTCSRPANWPPFVGLNREQDQKIRDLTKRGVRVTLEEIWPKLWDILNEGQPCQPYAAQPLEHRYTQETVRATMALPDDPIFLESISHISGMDYVPLADQPRLAIRCFDIVRNQLIRNQGYSLSTHNQTPSHGTTLHDAAAQSHWNIPSTSYTTGLQDVTQDLHAPLSLTPYSLSPNTYTPLANSSAWQTDQLALGMGNFGEDGSDSAANYHGRRPAVHIGALPAMSHGNLGWNDLLQPGALLGPQEPDPRLEGPYHPYTNHVAGRGQVFVNPPLVEPFGPSNHNSMPYNFMTDFEMDFRTPQTEPNRVPMTISPLIATALTQPQLEHELMDIDDNRGNTGLDPTDESNHTVMPGYPHWDS